MEYENLYTKVFDESHLNSEKYIKEKLIESSKNDISFGFIANKLSIEFEIKSKNNKFKTNNFFKDLLFCFEKNISKYSKNKYENIFKNDIKLLFDNSNIHEYSFEQLIKDMAKYHSELNTYRIFSNESHLFEIIYKSEDFSKFEIK